MLGLHRTTTARARRHPARPRSARIVAVAVVAGLSLGAAACSSSSPTAATTTTVKINPAQATAAITTAYNTLFNLSNPDLSGKLVVIQDGQQISGAMQQALSSSEASAAQGAKIHTVKILTPAQCAKQSLPSQCAHVVYDILGTGGTAILPNNNGYAVYTNGHWLVSKVTICTLLGLFYTAEGKTGSPPGC